MVRLRRRSRILVRLLLLALLAAVASCGGDAEGAGKPGGEGVSVVATTTILGELTRAVVGEHGAVEVLLPVGADPHDYQLSARQVAAMQAADLVVANGLALESGMEDALEAAAADGAAVLTLGEQVDPIPFGAAAPDASTTNRADEHALDPHFWLDPQRVARAVDVVTAALTALDSDVDWSAQADPYRAEMLEADARIAQTLEPIPDARRKLVTNHDSLGYFAARYGFVVVGTVIPGGSTVAAPSSARLAALVEQIRREQVPAIFVETTESAALAEALAAEIGESVEVVELYTGSLGPQGSGADSLAGMLITNAERIAAALS